MHSTTNSVFYDGASSTPQEVSLIFDDEKLVLLFESSEENQYSWRVEDVNLDVVGNKTNITNVRYPFQKLILNDQTLVETIATTKKKNGSFDLYQQLIHFGPKFYFAIAILILGIIGLSYVYVIPWVAEKAVVLIPKEYDDKLSDGFLLKNVIFKDKDSIASINLNLFAKELALNNTKPLKFSVINAKEINAFALPDGNIVVYSGILDEMKSYDELVALLGHEVSHVNNRHSMKAICRNLSGYIFISVILGDANGVMAVIGDNANNLQSLSFSRDFERQADEDGFGILKSNKINPKGMSTLFSRLKDHSLGIVPEFLSTHPLTEERIRFVEKMIKENPYSYDDNPRLQSLFNKIKVVKTEN